MAKANKHNQSKDAGTKLIKVPRFEEQLGFYATKKSSAIMSKIKSKNTKAEILLRKELWQRQYRYRLHASGLAGKPDIIFKMYKLIIFVDGDFWHGYNWELRKPKMKKNRGYWIPKIERNMQRDLEVNTILESQGWTVLRFWENEVFKNLEHCISQVQKTISDKKKDT